LKNACCDADGEKSVKIKGGIHPLMPVYTSAPFPKPRIPELLAELRKVELDAPISLDQVVKANILDTGIDVNASRDMKRV
jgi:CxxC motif-containing protein